MQRAEALKIPEFPLLGRIRNSKVRVKDTTFSSRYAYFNSLFIIFLSDEKHVLHFIDEMKLGKGANYATELQKALLFINKIFHGITFLKLKFTENQVIINCYLDGNDFSFLFIFISTFVCLVRNEFCC